MYISPLILYCLYFLSLIISSWHCNNLSPNYIGEVKGQWFIDRSVVSIMGDWVCLIWKTTGLLKDWFT